MRGYELAVKAHGGKAGGKEIETIVGSTDASPDSAIRAAKKLVEQDKVDVLISPLSGSEGIAVRDYSKTQPQITVINASSGALETTYGDPSPASRRRRPSIASTWMAPSGMRASAITSTTSSTTRRSRRSARTTAFIYTQVMGLTLEYCKAGGQISKRFWVPLGTKDFASVIAVAARMTSTPSISASAAPTR